MSSVVLLSGGLDSTVALALSEDAVEAVTVDYGQTHRREIGAAAQIAAHYGVPHTVITISGLPFLSALTGAGEIPTNHADKPDATYVPGRNTMLIALAASRAESVGANQVVIGANADDAAGYPDCRPEYLEAFRDVLMIGTVNHVWVRAPLLYLRKPAVVARAAALGVPVELTWSCYRGGAVQCGRCGACEANGVPCPTA